MISFTCPSCNAPINIDDSAAGKQGECIQCKSQVIVPGKELAKNVQRNSPRMQARPIAEVPNNSWFVSKDGKEFGPFTDDQLMALAGNGQVTPDTRVRTAQQTTWSLAQSVDGLFAALPKLRLADRASTSPASVNVNVPFQPTMLQATAIPVGASVPPPRKTGKKLSSTNRVPLFLGGGAFVIALVAAVGVWFKNGSADPAISANSEVRISASNTASATKKSSAGSQATVVEGEWYFEGIPVSPKYSQPAVLTIRGKQAEWREINSNSLKPVSDFTSLSDGAISLDIDGYVWDVKPLPNGELYFVQQGKQPLFFPTLKPYDRNLHKPAPVAPSTDLLPLSEITWKELDDIYNIKNQRTDLQKDAAWRSYKDKRVQWSGEVRSVSESFGSLTVNIRMNDDTITRDLQIKLLPSERAKAEQLAEGSHIAFTATLVDYAGAILPFRLKDGVIKTSGVSTAEMPSARANENSASTESLSISSVTWKELDEIYDIEHQRTDLQKETAWRSYKGKRIQWSGEVRSVEDSLGSLTLGVRMDEDTITYDLQIELLRSERAKAEQLSEGDRVSFAATLVDYAGAILPFRLKDGVIITNRR